MASVTSTDFTPALQTGEEWRPVVGYEGLYSVSSHGRVRRDAAGQGTRPGRLLACKSISAKGYVRVSLSRGPASNRFWMLHRLVAAAFIGPCPDGMEVNHRNGNKLDNRSDNLEYVSHRDNVLHAFAAGLTVFPKGSGQHQAKLTEDIVAGIRSDLRAGASLGAMARRHGVSKRTIGCIRDRVTWRHIG